MMVGGPSRISQQVRERNSRQFGIRSFSSSCSNRNSCFYRGEAPPRPPRRVPFCFECNTSSAKSSRLKSLTTSASCASSSSSITSNSDELPGMSFVSSGSCAQDKSQAPVLSDLFSLAENGGEPTSEAFSPVTGGIVALGKFDALHIGHRELAIQAAEIGVPFLLSFAGMAEILGWAPRAPIVARCDRKRVLSSWAQLCHNIAPKEFQLEFSKVRHLTPQQFVEKLSKELGICGVVAGENYRFGYKAAGNATDLVRLCNEYGMKSRLINCIMDKNPESSETSTSNSKEQGQVSSTRVRHALANGDMKYVTELLGRPHRLMLTLENKKRFFKDRKRLTSPRSCFLNLPPKDAHYRNCSLIIGDETVLLPCRVVIDTAGVHLELDELDARINSNTQNVNILGIDFGDSTVSYCM